MKVIDIMQKVANKEIFKFRIDDVNYYVDKSNYICEEDGTKVEWYIDDEWLNMNAEIIEEPKKIEKIEMCTGGIMSFDSVENITTELKDKINELIEEINAIVSFRGEKYTIPIENIYIPRDIGDKLVGSDKE